MQSRSWETIDGAQGATEDGLSARSNEGFGNCKRVRRYYGGNPLASELSKKTQRNKSRCRAWQFNNPLPRDVKESSSPAFLRFNRCTAFGLLTSRQKAKQKQKKHWTKFFRTSATSRENVPVRRLFHNSGVHWKVCETLSSVAHKNGTRASRIFKVARRR